MRLVFHSNPRSGRGVSLWARRIFPSALRGAGHDVVEVAVGDPDGRLGSALAGAGALIVAGGDGTVHRAAREAIRAEVPLYHVPCGNENLFARQFAMDRTPETLLRALERPRTLRVDAMAVQDDAQPAGPEVAPPGVLSLLMCSIGPDAGVIRRLTQLRTRAIGHMAYGEPIIREWLAPSFAPITLRLDGRTLCTQRAGTLLVANSRQYAFRIDPARRADMTDGLLDVVFLPGATRRSLLAWALRCRLRRPIEAAGAIYATGREARITTSKPAPYQIDGDSPGWRGAGQENCPPECSPLSLRIAVWPAVLPVLLPVPFNRP